MKLKAGSLLFMEIQRHGCRNCKTDKSFYASTMGLWNSIHLSWVSNRRGKKSKFRLILVTSCLRRFEISTLKSLASMIADSSTKSNIHEAGLHRYDNNYLDSFGIEGLCQKS